MVELTQEQLNTMKALETEMLATFVEVCHKLSLRYYMVGGTLLGAVRHQGFIPWDDDIDVAMPREDYEIFLREGQKYLPEHLFLQNLDTDPGYLMNFAKIRDNRTTFVEYAVRKRDMHHGVFIDIFPLDGYPEGEKAQKKMDFHQLIHKYRLRAAVEVPKEAQHSLPVEVGMRCVSALTCLIQPNFRKAQVAREQRHRAAAGSSLWANYCGAWGKKEIMPAEWYGQGVELDFEGLKIKGPEHWDKWLTQVYGDYMRLPPVEKRVAHHYAEAIDLETSYIEYNQNHLRK